MLALLSYPFVKVVLSILKNFGKVVWSVIKTTIPIPIGILVAAVLWYAYDKNSAIKEAVETAVQELVAGAELQAQKSIINNQQKIIDNQRALIQERDRIIERDRKALREYESDIEQTESRLEAARRFINELQNAPNSKPAPDDFFDRLLNQ